MQTPFKARDPIVSKHKLRLLIDPDVVDANLVACLACESVVIEGVKLNAFDLLVVDEPSVYPGLSSVTDLYRISDCCKQLSLQHTLLTSAFTFLNWNLGSRIVSGFGFVMS